MDSGDERNLNRPDLEAEPINSKRTKNLEVSNKQDLMKQPSDRKIENKQKS